MPRKTSGPQSASASAPESLELSRTPPPRERADAARNRTAILDAAARLFAEHGVEGVSMDAVAAAAGVGKGTLFRRFGDKAGLAVALIDGAERTLQERILTGPAPLGPDGEPAERLLAFTAAYGELLLGHLDLVGMSETASPGARYRIGAYRFWHRHLTIVFESIGDGVDPAYAAHALLAALEAEHVRAVLADLGEARWRAGTRDLAEALATRARG